MNKLILFFALIFLSSLSSGLVIPANTMTQSGTSAFDYLYYINDSDWTTYTGSEASGTINLYLNYTGFIGINNATVKIGAMAAGSEFGSSTPMYLYYYSYSTNEWTYLSGLTSYGINTNYSYSIPITSQNQINLKLNLTYDTAISPSAKLYEIENNIAGLKENSQTYSSSTYTASYEYFSINLTYDTNYYTSAVGYLNYNNTLYPSSISSSEGSQVFTSSLTVPSTQGTYPFYWVISLTNSTGTFSFNSTNYTQSLNSIKLQICNQSFNVSYINFSLYDSESSRKVNGTFKASFFFGSNSEGLLYSYQDLTERNSSFKFCISPSSQSVNISANIEYESTNYAKNYYYLTGAGFSNQTTDIPLYLLNSSKATALVLQTLDLSKIPISEVIIQIQAYDAGTDTYKTVGMSKSDYKGEDVAYLNWYDTFYKFILTKNNNLLLVTNSSKVTATPKTFLIGQNFVYDYDKFNNVIYSLTFNNLTNNFILTYTDPTGQINSNCLRVIKRNIINDSIVCNTCESSSSATLYCNIASYGNGTYLATYYGVGSLYGFDTIEQVIGFGNSMHDLIGSRDGIIYAILLTSVVVGISLISPIFGIVGVILGVIGSLALGFLPTEQFLLPTIGLAIVGGIIIWLLKR